MSEDNRRRRGPKPEHLKSDLPWKEAVRKAVKKKRPEKGWPKAEEPKKKPEDESTGS